MTSNLTERSARFVKELAWDDLPTDVIDWAKAGIADTIGVTLAAADSDVATTLARSGTVVGVTDRPGPGVVPMLGFAGFAPPTEAALAMGTVGHALDFDDVGGFGHPSTVLAPVLLALGHGRGVSGREAILAYVAGFEVGSRVADRNLFGRIDTSSHRRGQHPTSVFGTVAAACTAARLLQLSVEQTQTAIGIAGSQSSGLLRNFGTMTKPLHAGLAARAGVFAAQLAATGFTAEKDVLPAFLAALNPVLASSEERQQELIGSLGTKWDLSRGLAIKRYPACWSSHRAVTGLLDMLGGKPLDLDMVEAIEVDRRETPLLRLAPTNGLEGKFSMAFNLAITAVKGTLPEIDDYAPDRFADPAVQRAMSLLEQHKDASDDIVRIAVRYTAGETDVREVKRALGDPSDGFDRAFIADKVRRCSVRALSEARAAELSTLLAGLDGADDIDRVLEVSRAEAA